MKKYFIVKKTYGNGSVEYIPYMRGFIFTHRVPLRNGALRCPTKEAAQEAIDAIRVEKIEVI